MNAQQHAPNGEVLAFQIGHVRETVDRIEKKLDAAATKEEVAELRATVKILWDERTAAKAVVGLVGLIGVGNLVAIARLLVGQQ